MPVSAQGGGPEAGGVNGGRAPIFGVGDFTTHFRTYFSGDGEYGLLTHGHVGLLL